LPNSFLTFIAFSDEEDVDELHALQLANSINASYMPNQVYVNEDKLWSAYYLLVADALSEKLFIDVMRRCSHSFISAVREHDEHDLVG